MQMAEMETQHVQEIQKSREDADTLEQRIHDLERKLEEAESPHQVQIIIARV